MNFKSNGTNSILPPNSVQNCPHRLPCGICSKTDRICPINPGLVQPTWISSQPE